jgi:DNA-binding transcriptional LysR family regulator
MDRLLAMDVFARVVELGSFAKAAERMDISTSACSRHVADLEAHLDTRLLNRTTRRLSLTESGQAYYERCVQLLADLEEAEGAAALSTARPRGTLKLSCGISFGVRHVARLVGEFAACRPEVKFHVQLADRFVDLVEEGFDLAIRVGEAPAQNLIARRLGETRLVPCAAPLYLREHGAPQSPADLARHACLTYEYLPLRNTWRFVDRAGAEHAVRVAGPVHANNGDLLAAAAIEGIGIAMEPDFIVAADLAAGRLVRVLADYAPAPTGVYAVYPSRRHLSAKVRSFVDFLAERFGEAGGSATPAP